MPEIKITSEVRTEIISEWVKGKTLKALAVEHNVTDRAISADKKTYAHIWKIRAMECARKRLLSGVGQREYIENNLNLHAETDKEHLEFIENARFDLHILDSQLKRVGSLFKEKGKKQGEGGQKNE